MKPSQNALNWSYRFGQLPPPSATPSKKRGLGLVRLGMEFDLLASGFKMIEDFLVGKTNNFDSKSFENSCAFCISSQSFWGVVLRTINFNHQFSRGAIEIHNKMSNWALFQPTLRLQPQALIPQLLLGFGHLRTQFLRSRSQLFIINKPLHLNILKQFPLQTPSFSRGSPKAGGVPRSSRP
jgi:hypothetical protein